MDIIEEMIETSIVRTRSRPVVFIDYIQVRRPEGGGLKDKQNMDQIIIRLKKLSRRLNLPVIGVSSLNRASYKEDPSLADYKESGAVEYSADVLLRMQLRKGPNEDNDDVKNKNPRPIALLMQKK